MVDVSDVGWQCGSLGYNMFKVFVERIVIWLELLPECYHSKHIVIIATAFISSLTLAGLLYFFLFAPPKPIWNPSADTEIIGLGVSGEVDSNYIPDVQLWGDGRIVWVEYDSVGNRQVFEGHLSKEEMKGLINQFINAGFFDRNKLLDELVFGPSLRIKLLNADYFAPILDGTFQNGKRNQNRNLDSLVDFLKSGAGAERTEFVPSTGTLLVFNREETSRYDVEATIYQWPDNKFGYGLASVRDNPKEISGEELAFAWDIVNTPVPLVESHGEIYWIAVIVPKISY